MLQSMVGGSVSMELNRPAGDPEGPRGDQLIFS